MASDACPQDEHLAAWALGNLPSTELERIGFHVSACADCQARMAGADGARDALLDHVCRARAGGEVVEDAALSRLLQTASGLDISGAAFQTAERPGSGRRFRVGVLVAILAAAAALSALVIVGRRGEGRLVVVVPADNVQVLVDGIEVELHDRRAEASLKPGPHHLRVLRPGFLDHDEDIEARPGETVERTPVLRRPPQPAPDENWFALTSKWKLFPMESCPQARKVGEKLAELNPGFDPNLKHMENFQSNFNAVGGDGKKTAIVRLTISTDQVTNLSPVAAFTQLNKLECRGSAPGKGRLYGLSPLKGLKLTTLDCRNNAIDDFSVLKDVPIKWIWCDEPERRWQELQQITTLRQINGKAVPWKRRAPEPDTTFDDK